MAPGGVVAHSSSWTPAAYELEESSPLSRVLCPLDSARGHGSGLPGEEGHGDKVVYILICLTAGNAAGYRGGFINAGIEDILVLPAISVVSLLPGPALRDGFLPGSSDRCSRGIAASFWPAVAAAAVLRVSTLRRPSATFLQTLLRLLCHLFRQWQSTTSKTLRRLLFAGLGLRANHVEKYVLFSARLHVAVALKKTRVDLRSAQSFMTCVTLPRLCGPQCQLLDGWRRSTWNSSVRFITFLYTARNHHFG